MIDHLMTFQDYLSFSPLIILLLGGLLLILIESFHTGVARNWSFSVALATLAAAGAAEITAPSITYPLLSLFIVSDWLAQFFIAFFLIVGAAVVLISAAFFRRSETTQGEYYFLLLAALAGLMLIAQSADFLTLFLGLEILSISLYVLVAYVKKWDLGHESALKFFLLGSLATTIFLFGVGLIYGAVGTTQFQGLLAHFQQLTLPAEKTLFLGGAALVTLGLFFKAAVVPFHLWAPDVYEGASTPVTAFLAVASKGGAFAALSRVFLVALPGFDPHWSHAVSYLAIASLLFANLLALRQTTFRRFFAYSGISHSAFLLIPLAAGGAEALYALLYYLVVYAAASLGAFAVLVALDAGNKDVRLDSLRGLYAERPWLSVVLAVCLLTLSGFPPFAGFFAKFFLFKTAYEAGYLLLIAVGLLMTVLSVYYYFRIIVMLFSAKKDSLHAEQGKGTALLVGACSFALLLYLTVFPDIFS